MATSGARRRGFEPARSLHNAGSPRTTLYPVSGDNAIIMNGDAVCLAGGRAAVFTTALANYFVGIVKACYDSNRKPFTFAQPTRGPYMPASTGGYVEVWDDPDTTFIVESDVSVGNLMIGQMATVNVTAGVTLTGISRMHIGTIAASATDSPWRIIGLGDNELDRLGGANNDVEVKAVRHYLLKQD